MRPVFTRTRTFVRATRRRVTTHLAEVRAKHKARPDGGYTTETVIITALLVGFGLAALAVLGSKVLDKVNALSF